MIAELCSLICRWTFTLKPANWDWTEWDLDVLLCSGWGGGGGGRGDGEGGEVLWVLQNERWLACCALATPTILFASLVSAFLETLPCGPLTTSSDGLSLIVIKITSNTWLTNRNRFDLSSSRVQLCVHARTLCVDAPIQYACQIIHSLKIYLRIYLCLCHIHTPWMYHHLQKYCSHYYVSNLSNLRTEGDTTNQYSVQSIEQVSMEFNSCSFVVSLFVHKLGYEVLNPWNQ